MNSRRASKRKNARAAETKSTALEAIDRFVRVLTLMGMSREEMMGAFEDAYGRLPERLLKSKVAPQHEFVDAAHILTLWLSDPNYLDAQGDPLRVPLRGRTRSLEALIQRLDTGVDPKHVADYLVRSGSVIKVGSRYFVKKRNVLFAPDSDLAHAHGFRAVLGVLRTIENNAKREGNPRYWFENHAGNTRFPARLAGDFDAKLKRLGMDFLKRLDADMQRAEQLVRPGEPTVHLTVGLYQCEEESPKVHKRKASGRAMLKSQLRR